MKGDFSRLTFDAKKNFSRVLIQQGRVQLDADANEQADILLHHIRMLTRDLIGAHAGPDPNEGGGFVISQSSGGEDPFDLRISGGHYYVEGILCENPELWNERPVSIRNQPYYFPDRVENLKLGFLVYLDVWERSVTGFEEGGLNEVALGGIDTSARGQTVWQVKILPLKDGETDIDDLTFETWTDSRLRARCIRPATSEDPCNFEPDARYRGAENQLYRVEVHFGNVDKRGQRLKEQAQATFKWSRENGSVIFPIVSIGSGEAGKTTVELANLGRDDKLGLRKGDMVEIIDDRYTLHNGAEKLLKVEYVDQDEMKVKLEGVTKITVSQNSANHPLLRRWDQKAAQGGEAGVRIIETHEGDNRWIDLEDGVQIQFLPNQDGTPANYRTGDYWLIPARTATRDVEWPKRPNGEPVPQPPRGVRHYYAPLALFGPNGIEKESYRCEIFHNTSCAKKTEEPHIFKAPAAAKPTKAKAKK